MSPRARLVRLEGEDEVARLPLGDEFVIGRDPADTDLVIDHPRISRRHLRVRAHGDGHLVEDLGSSNGTSLNGEPLRGVVALEPGDVLVLGGAATFVYEVGGGRATALLVAGAGAVLVLAVAIGAVWWWSAPGTDPLWQDATRLAREAIAASERNDAAVVKRRLTEAFDLLWSNGRLDDIPHGPLARAQGLARLSEAVGDGVDLNELYRMAIEASRPKLVAHVSDGCRLDRIDPREVDGCVRERTRQVLVELWQEPNQVPESFYEAVREQMAFLLRGGFDVDAALERGAPHMEMMRTELEAEYIPGILRYLPMIESAYRNEAKSAKAAGGMWQFMPATARQYGLAVGNGVDERTDPRKATRAAARYLNGLAMEWGEGALLLAIASYNRGENGVRAALKKLKNPRTERTYWSLAAKGLIPAETRDYVPRFVAAAVLGEAGIPPASSLP